MEYIPCAGYERKLVQMTRPSLKYNAFAKGDQVSVVKWFKEDYPIE